MNTIERVRIKVGLTKPQILSILEAKPGRVLTARDERLDPIYIMRAQEVESAYEVWRDLIIQKLHTAVEASKDGYLRTRTVARILGISDFHLSQMRIRGQVEAIRDGARRFKYSEDQIINLITSNSEVLGTELRKNRGPLTNAFLAWREENPIALAVSA